MGVLSPEAGEAHTHTILQGCRQECKWVEEVQCTKSVLKHAPPLRFSYPLYRKGNPQLRVFLPNFWMKLVKVEHRSLQPHQVNFIVSSEMTSIDVKNYLEKIYKVPVMDVRTANYTGKVAASRLFEVSDI